MVNGGLSRHTWRVPRLWAETIETHRRDVRDAIVQATARLVGEHGLAAVTMSQIAEETGIGRATLYKYFGGVDEILLAWHQRQISHHLHQLTAARDRAAPADRLTAVLTAYAEIAAGSQGHHDSELAAFLHRDRQVVQAEEKLRGMISELISEAAEMGSVRTDVAADELADYCLHALAAARSLPSKAAVRRLVEVTLGGLRPQA